MPYPVFYSTVLIMTLPHPNRIPGAYKFTVSSVGFKLPFSSMPLWPVFLSSCCARQDGEKLMEDGSLLVLLLPLLL